MIDESKFKEFLAYAKRRMHDEKGKEEDYCVVIYLDNRVEHIFKRLKDFRLRGMKTINAVEGVHKIDLTPWKYA